MKRNVSLMLAGVSLIAMATAGGAPAIAQNTGSGSTVSGISEIVVTARRREESLQNVPIFVDVTSGQDLDQLALTQLEDIAALVPGLELAGNGVFTNASIRGVDFSSVTSGNNQTVEFYVNDTSSTASNALQGTYDIGQVEVLRGPQGTLRGRASPSGSITVRTRLPDLEQYGGNIRASKTSLDHNNVQGAVNIPLIKNMLGLRFAGLYDENKLDGIESLNNSREEEGRSISYRGTVLFQPSDTFSLRLTHQYILRKTLDYPQLESAHLADPTLTPMGTLIRPFDRLSPQRSPSNSRDRIFMTNWEAAWEINDYMKLTYVGAYNDYKNAARPIADSTGFFGPSFDSVAGFYPLFGQQRPKSGQQDATHEARLQSVKPLWGKVDYTVGAFYKWADSQTELLQQTAVFLFAPTPGTFLTLAETPIQRSSNLVEESVFGNVNLHLTDRTELSAGIRYISYRTDATLAISGSLVAPATEHYDFDHKIYTSSLTHRWNDNLMTYASFGTSFRPAILQVGEFSIAPSALEQSFKSLPPETSKNYEIGFKTDWLDRRVQFNVSAFHQAFKNYPFRGPAAYFIDHPASMPAGEVSVFSNYAAPVEVDVNGVEVDLGLTPIDDWVSSIVFSYAKGQIKNGVFPCNDFSPNDGIPDAEPVTQPSLATLTALAGSDNILTCGGLNRRSSSTPYWSTTLRSEYSHPVTPFFDAYIRGLMTVKGKTDNNPDNPFDDVGIYQLSNLYLGIRDPEGAWEVSLFGKNITNTEKILNRGSSPTNVPARIVFGPTPIISGYRSVSVTPEREFGIQLKYAFGSR